MLSLLVSLSLAQTCAPGQLVTVDTRGHCCWPAQAWSSAQSRCVGVPTCAAPMVARGEACVIACPEGQRVDADTQGHCCWPGQAWSSSRAVCVGVPQCPQGFSAAGEACTAAPAPVAPPTPEVVSPPLEEPLPPPPLDVSPAEPACPVGSFWNAAGGRCEASAAVPSAPPACPVGSFWNAAEGRCEASAAVPSAPPPVISARKPAAAKDPYVSVGRADIRLVAPLDFSNSLVSFGLESDVFFSFTRAKWGRFGVGGGLGYLNSFGTSAEAGGRWVLFFPVSLFAAIRLGHSWSEFIVRLGGDLGIVTQFDTTRALGKLSASAEFLIGLGGGKGITVGVEVLTINGWVVMPKAGVTL